MALKAIKSKIRSIGKTHQVTKAMEAVSAVKMRRSQERALTGRPYATTALSILERVGGMRRADQHPLMQKRDPRTFCLVVITSDKGLAGSLNTAVLKEAQRFITDRGLDASKVSIIALGRKARDYFEKRGFTVVHAQDTISDEVTLQETRTITSLATELFLNKRVDEVVVFYTNFRSTFEQKSVGRVVLPIAAESIRKIVEDILPTSGRFAKRQLEEVRPVTAYTIEPNAEEVLNELLPFLVNISLYHAQLEAKASEHSARMVAMKNASDRAHEIGRELTLAFNKERQSEITREMSEITGGMESMSN